MLRGGVVFNIHGGRVGEGGLDEHILFVLSVLFLMLVGSFF